MTQILAAFHDTLFAKPVLSIQPVGQLTLVNLPTYFEITWPTQGFQPAEIDSVQIIGFPVQIRPTFVSATYHFGDGTTSGQVTSLGGPFPTGDVVKTYPRTGDLTVHASVEFGGEFRVGAGPWLPITETVVIAGPTQVLRVREARARLVG